MMICGTHGHAQHSRGFTLLELLVVLIIIGILLSMATLTVGGGNSKQVYEEAQRLLSLIDLAEQESVLKAQELVLTVVSDGYLFQLETEDGFVPVEESGALRPRELPEGMRLKVEVEGQQQEASLTGEIQPAQVWIMSSGEVSPFRITLESDDGPTYYLDGDSLGGLSLKNATETL